MVFMMFCMNGLGTCKGMAHVCRCGVVYIILCLVCRFFGGRYGVHVCSGKVCMCDWWVCVCVCVVGGYGVHVCRCGVYIILCLVCRFLWGGYGVVCMCVVGRCACVTGGYGARVCVSVVGGCGVHVCRCDGGWVCMGYGARVSGSGWWVRCLGVCVWACWGYDVHVLVCRCVWRR